MQLVEAMDCKVPSQNRLGNVTGIIGDRVHVTYINTEVRAVEDPGKVIWWLNVLLTVCITYNRHNPDLTVLYQ